jgi:drug/metabolite transporter (DMT)-like permease
MFESAGRTGAGIASVLGNLQPLMVIVVAAVLLAEPVTRDKVAALAVGLIGVTLVTAPTIAGADAYGVAGPLVALGASASLSLGNALLKRTDMSSGVLVVTGWQLVLGGLPLLAISAVAERTEPLNWTPEFAGLLVGLALGGTAVPFAVWNLLAQREEIGRLALFLFLVPAFGVAFAAVAFGERYGPLQLAGIAMTLLAGAIAARGARAPAVEISRTAPRLGP